MSSAIYIPSDKRYKDMEYRRCGRSGLKLPAISLGLQHNFGHVDVLENSRTILRRAFDKGITHFDLANNYGPPPGSTEENFGAILREDFKGYRDELIISTKAGYTMWQGPYGNWGSRKHLISSLNQSLQRMGLDYVDIFYHHRPDRGTPLEETMTALSDLVRQGKALYVGISNYPTDLAIRAIKILKEMGTPCVIHQPKYSMFIRWIEEDLLDRLTEEGVGCIAFSPLAQGLLTDRYLHGIPEGSRVAKGHSTLTKEAITNTVIRKIQALNAIARERGQTLAQMALTWVLRDPRITSTLLGVSLPEQLDNCLGCLAHPPLSLQELNKIEEVVRR
jgi:L-glyceraldehyde 3-phosphate reductase